ncbi:hypothetical protein HYQ46_012217 [Verticillium longisporum]|nr:hypothetical protein HYQ46_012217 [Verticillium longisporum]
MGLICQGKHSHTEVNCTPLLLPLVLWGPASSCLSSPPPPGIRIGVPSVEKQPRALAIQHISTCARQHRPKYLRPESPD